MNALPIRSLALAAGASMLIVSLACADPGVRVDVQGGQARVALIGDYAGARYTVYRGDAVASTLAPISTSDALCTGDCFVFDAAAQIGGTYQYRFDLLTSSGALVSYGPYRVSIGAPVTGFAVRAISSPWRGAGMLRVSAGDAGASRASGLSGRVALYDVTGRQVRELWRGRLDQLTFDVAWDGRDASGVRAAPGVYLARFEAGTHVSAARVVVSR
jgi:hypothetical protein